MRLTKVATIALILVVSISALWATTLWVSATPPATQINQAPGALMRSKLAKSQAVLEALLRKDFDGVAQGAVQMKHISEAAEWPRARDEVYEHFGAIFRRQCNQLESLANQSNHEGATFVYLQMTTTCIQCHDYVRDSLRVAERNQNGVQLIPAEWPERKVEKPVATKRTQD